MYIRFTAAVVISEENGTICQFSVRIKETERSQGFVRQCFSTRMVFVELEQVGEIFTLIVHIRNERIEFGFLAVNAHLNNLFIRCTACKAFSPHITCRLQQYFNS